jgi:hypothetical protein
VADIAGSRTFHEVTPDYAALAAQIAPILLDPPRSSSI